MKNNDIYDKWTRFINKYKEYFLSNTELWCNSLEQVINYIDINKKRPSSTDKNKEIKSLGSWCSSQQDNYKKCLQIMKNNDIYDKWTRFINKYKEYFISNEEIWYDKLDKVIVYIDANNKKPSNSDKNKEIKSLGYWCSSQQDNYKKCLQIMKNKEIYNKWTQFINKYKEYFISNEEIWYDKLDKVIVYIDANKKRPSENDKNNDIKSLGKWVTMQNFSSKKKSI